MSLSISFPPGGINPAGGVSASNILREAVPPKKANLIFIDRSLSCF